VGGWRFKQRHDLPPPLSTPSSPAPPPLVHNNKQQQQQHSSTTPFNNPSTTQPSCNNAQQHSTFNVQRSTFNVHSGYLCKKGSATGLLGRRNWKERFFILPEVKPGEERIEMCYYENDKVGATTMSIIL
jgi:hypothetical protein